MYELVWAASIVSGNHAVWAEWAKGDEAIGSARFGCNDEEVIRAFDDSPPLRPLGCSLGEVNPRIEDSFSMATFLVQTVRELYGSTDIVSFYGSKYAPRVPKHPEGFVIDDGPVDDVTHRHPKLPESRFGFYNPRFVDYPFGFLHDPYSEFRFIIGS
jgi:hypothetical protein